MVWASDTFGAKPDFWASSITASTSDFHHSPAFSTICLLLSYQKCDFDTNYSGNHRPQPYLQETIELCSLNFYLIQWLPPCRVWEMDMARQAWAKSLGRHGPSPSAIICVHAKEACPVGRIWWSCICNSAPVGSDIVWCTLDHQPNLFEIVWYHACHAPNKSAQFSIMDRQECAY